jgi:hypothetical protein
VGPYLLVLVCRPLVDLATLNGFTPLMYAAWFDHPETVVALLQAGAMIKRRTMGHGYMSDPHC